MKQPAKQRLRREISDRARQTSKLWYTKNKSRIFKMNEVSRRRQRVEHPIKVMLQAAKYKSKRNGIAFDIEVKDVEKRTHCPVFNFELDYHPHPTAKGEPRPSNVASLDRIIPELGYTKGNVIIVSLRANILKRDASPEELKLLAEFYCKEKERER